MIRRCRDVKKYVGSKFEKERAADTGLIKGGRQGKERQGKTSTDLEGGGTDKGRNEWSQYSVMFVIGNKDEVSDYRKRLTWVQRIIGSSRQKEMSLCVVSTRHRGYLQSLIPLGRP